MRFLLTGRNGQVGWELERALASVGDVIAFDRQTLDLAKPDEIITCIREIKPDVIVNAAAYTAVDMAEKEPELAMAINGVAPGILAREAKRLGALLVHYSTDYVFDGTKGSPYTEQDSPNPINVYGKTKLAGERVVQESGCRHLILRTAWVYSGRGRNFLLTMLRLGRERTELNVVDDQVGAPTSARLIAGATAAAVAGKLSGRSLDVDAFRDASGLYHLTAAGRTTWYGFARAILSGREGAAKVLPIPTLAYPTPAPRPKNSVLDNSKLEKQFGFSLPDWQVGLKLCMEELGG